MPTPVPYSGAPEVAPGGGMLPNPSINTPIDAFGGAVAGAVTHVGETAQGVGRELFARGYAMQEMDQQFKADKATADTMDKQTQTYLWYDQFKGADRMKMFPEYQQRLRQDREGGAVDLESPYAKMQYLRETRSNEGRMLWHGAGLARQGLDEADHFASKAKLGAIGDQLTTLGVGEGKDFDTGVDTMKQTAGDYLVRNGLATPGTKEYDDGVRNLVSPQVAKIAHNIGRTDPAKGKALLDQYIKRGLVTGEDAVKYGPALDSAVETHGARNTAISVARGDPKHWGDEAYEEPVASAGLKAAPGTAGSYSSEGAELPDGSYRIGKYGANSALVNERLPGLGLKNEAGNDVKTLEDFKQSPKAQEDFRKTVFPQLQAENKTFKGAFKAWAGTNDPTQLNAALNGVAKAAPPDMVAGKARDAMAKIAPNSPVGQDNAAEMAVQHQNTDRRIDDLSQTQNRNEVVRMITSSDTGKVPVTLGEALKDKDFADKYNRLTPDEQGHVLKTLDDNSKLGGVRENAAGQLAYSKLRSIAINRDTTSTPEELDSFANTNILTLPISPAHKNELVKLQHDVMSGQIANPNMTHAMGLPAVQKLLMDAGISKKDTPEEFNKFTNAYHDAVVNYGKGAERSVRGDQELTDIAKGLISSHANTWSGWWHGEKQPYSDLYNSSDKLKKLGNSLFTQTQQRAMDPSNDADVETANRLLMQTIYQKYGQQAKPKAGNRVQP